MSEPGKPPDFGNLSENLSQQQVNKSEIIFKNMFH